MSEGERAERWVYERMPEGEVPGVWTYLGAEFICDASNAQSRVFYRRIPDPVPALEARISDYVDTVEAMLAAAGLDLSNHAEAEAEVSRFGTHPSDYIRAKFSEAQARIAELEGERNKLQSIKRLFTNYCKKVVELADWSAGGNGNLDLEWAADQVGNALSNAHLIDIGAYRPGVFMPPEAEEEPLTPAAAKEQ